MSKIGKFCFSLLCLLNIVHAIVKEDGTYWKHLGKQDIEAALSEEINTNVAKNVIIFVGDGMGPTTVTASRIYGKGEQGFLAFEQLPHIGVLKTYSADKLVPDSCSTATALFCGVKANQKTSGVDASVQKDDCEASLNEAARLESIIKWAQDAGKSTGFVTTTRVTHATPSALYAHVPNRSWECEAKIPKNASKKCKDIARQLVEDAPGRNINVIMGGGRQCLQSTVKNSSADPIDTWACYRSDNRNLFETWRMDKEAKGASYKIVQNNRELFELDTNTDYVLGVFANGHMKMDHERARGTNGTPSLTNMTTKAIDLLKKNKKGFLLVVEGGMIDFAHHRGHAKEALDETMSFSEAISKTLEITDSVSKETLIIVTSDHSHSLVFAGYEQRGESILGIAQKSYIDSTPYTSLLYGTGGANNYQYSATNNTIIRKNPTEENTEDFKYSQQAAVLTDEVTHDGTDVLVYAKGPMAHLFHKVHEQTYVAYVISYAAKIGPFENFRSSKSVRIEYSVRTLLAVLFLVLYTH